MSRLWIGSSLALSLALLAGCADSAPPPVAKAPAAAANATSSESKSDSKGSAAATTTTDSAKSESQTTDSADTDLAPKSAETTPAAPAPSDSTDAPPIKKAPAAEPAKEPAADDEKPSLEAAVQHAQGGDFPKAIEVLKKAREADKKNRQLLLALTQFNQMHAMQTAQGGDEAAALPYFAASAEAAKTLQTEFKPLIGPEGQLVGLAYYNQACMLSKTKKAEEALQFLSDAIDAGFNDLNQVDTDEDLVAVRELEAYKKMRSEAEQRLTAAAKKEVEENLKKFESFAFDFELPDLEGKATKLAAFKGKVVIVDIWGTWCPPCRMEIPHFVALQKKYKEQGLEIIGLNYENGSGDEVIKLIKEFAKENGINYTLLIGDDATQQKVPNFEGFPTTLFLDRSGKVRLMEVGYRPQAAIEAVITTLLSEPQPEGADAKPADAKPADEKPADAKPADEKPAEEKKPADGQ